MHNEATVHQGIQVLPNHKWTRPGAEGCSSLPSKLPEAPKENRDSRIHLSFWSKALLTTTLGRGESLALKGSGEQRRCDLGFWSQMPRFHVCFF